MWRSQLFGLLLIGGLDFVPITAAQNDPPAKHRIEFSLPPKAEASLEERLEAKGSFQAEEAPLRTFAGALEKALDTSVVLATKKLEEAAINVDTPLTYKLKNVRLQTGLKLILGDLGLAYMLRENVLLITTPEDASSQLITRVYDCRDLLRLPSPVKKLSHWRAAERYPGTGFSPLPRIEERRLAEEVGPDGGYTVDDLTEIITTIVHPDNWFDGNNNLVADFKGLVIISQTEEMHADIEKLLNQLHRAGGLKEKIKVFR